MTLARARAIKRANFNHRYKWSKVEDFKLDDEDTCVRSRCLSSFLENENTVGIYLYIDAFIQIHEIYLDWN